MDPYRDPDHRCPACQKPLRTFRERLACDACDGIFLPLADLAGAVHDLTSIDPEISFVKERAGERPCPRCVSKMVRCEVRIALDESTESPRAELDRCSEHGIWFDAEELAHVFEKVASKGFGGGVGRTQKKDGPAPGARGWTAYFKIGGSDGGW
ncbi:MAG: hypothetical protein ACKV2T_17935 [Kofleriaceae bacterium]